MLRCNAKEIAEQGLYMMHHDASIYPDTSILYNFELSLTHVVSSPDIKNMSHLAHQVAT